MAAFGYNAVLFPSRGARGRPVGYRRSARAADAIRFAIEELPAQGLVGAWLEVGEERFGIAFTSTVTIPWIARGTRYGQS